MEILEIRSSHDLTGNSPQARRAGAHSYKVNCRQFTLARRAWQRDAEPRAPSLGVMTLGFERIWITAEETKQVAEAIEMTRSPLALD